MGIIKLPFWKSRWGRLLLVVVERGEGGEELSLILPKAVECTNLETQAEPQQIVAQGLLSCLQYPVS